MAEEHERELEKGGAESETGSRAVAALAPMDSLLPTG
jgi:hypothetical protein